MAMEAKELMVWTIEVATNALIHKGNRNFSFHACARPDLHVTGSARILPGVGRIA
jgi:hypothetical protein